MPAVGVRALDRSPLAADLLAQVKEFPTVNEGFAKAAEQQATEAVRAVMHMVCENEIMLHSVVAGGLTAWMNHATRAFSGMPVDDQIIRDMFHYFESRADSDPKKKLDELLKAAAN